MLYPIPIRPGVEQQRASLLSLLAAVLMVTASLLPPPSLPMSHLTTSVEGALKIYITFCRSHNSGSRRGGNGRGGREGNRTGK